jgi:ATP-dependent RNA helicase RhlE
MGFIRDIRRITPLLPKTRQTLLFSATMPSDVADLAKGLLKDPVRVEVVPQSTTAERIDQKLFYVARGHKRALLAQLLGAPEMRRAIVFTRTKHGANRLAEQLEKDGFVTAAIHGNKSQGARQQALNAFKNGQVKVLVATDIAARGIDVDDISHIVNYELPMEPEAYVHRIGRTARAGASGIALSFCDGEERGLLRDIERIIRVKLPVVEDHPFVGAVEDAAARAAAGEGLPVRHRGGNRGQHQGRPGQGARKSANAGGGNRNHANGHANGHGGGRTQGAGASDSRNGGGENRQAQNRQGDHRNGEQRQGENRQARSGNGQSRDGQSRDGQNRNGQNRNGQNRNGQNRNGPARQGGHQAQTRHSDSRAGAKQR